MVLLFSYSSISCSENFVPSAGFKINDGLPIRSIVSYPGVSYPTSLTVLNL